VLPVGLAAATTEVEDINGGPADGGTTKVEDDIDGGPLGGAAGRSNSSHNRS
jgi:hypothetical protein